MMISRQKRAEQFMLEGRMDEALAVFEAALAGAPADARAWSDVGWALYDLGRHEEALVHLERALEIDPGRAEAWVCIGTIQTDPAESIRYLDKALALSPNHGSTWFLKSEAFREQGRETEADECLARAKSLDPKILSSTS
jgi:tetratricopeptide (TPR) repeat protein